MFYAPIKLGPNSSKTPEGFRLYEGVPIARTGLQIYGPSEIPIDDAGNGFVKVERFPEDVFRSETIKSAEGKPIVDEHPAGDVGPQNYRDLTRGHVQNVRRGEGIEDDLLLGDLLVMDQDAIDAIARGKKEISLGYDAKYERIGPGHARQYNIVINHCALVDSARCGPRCRIRDHAVHVRTHDAADCGLTGTCDTCGPDCACNACQAEYHPRGARPAAIDAALRKLRRRRHIHLHVT